MAVNKVIILGNLGADPEVKFTNQSLAVARLRIATSERRKDQSGNWGEHTEWHSVVVFGKSAENCGQYLKKGRQVYIEGRLQTKKWQDKEGRDRYTTEIIANIVQFVGGRNERPAEDSYDSAVGDYQGGSSSPGGSLGGYADSLKSADDIGGGSITGSGGAGSGGASFDDDDIPF